MIGPCGEVEYTHEFERVVGYTRRDRAKQYLRLLLHCQKKGERCFPFQYSSAIYDSRRSHMRELRIQHQGNIRSGFSIVRPTPLRYSPDRR